MFSTGSPLSTGHHETEVCFTHERNRNNSSIALWPPSLFLSISVLSLSFTISRSFSLFTLYLSLYHSVPLCLLERALSLLLSHFLSPPLPLLLPPFLSFALFLCLPFILRVCLPLILSLSLYLPLSIYLSLSPSPLPTRNTRSNASHNDPFLAN